MSTVQDELELGPEPAAATEASVTDALHLRYSQVHGNGRRYAVAAGVRSHAGFDARRTADYVAMDLWPSKGLALHGHEIKVSRSDWLRELKEPEKAAEFIPYMNFWWLVASHPRIVRDGELPEGWGLMVMRGPLLVVATRAPRRDAKPMGPSRLAALLRAVAQTSAYLERRHAEQQDARQARLHHGAGRRGADRAPQPLAGQRPARRRGRPGHRAPDRGAMIPSSRTYLDPGDRLTVTRATTGSQA